MKLVTNQAFLDLLESEFANLRSKLNDPQRFKTQEEMAVFLGVSQSVISRIRLGKMSLAMNTAKKFSERLREDPDERRVLADKLFLTSQKSNAGDDVGHQALSDDWKHLCVALMHIGGYPSVEDALTAAIRRECLSQKPDAPDSQ